MIYKINHSTIYHYAGNVSLCHNLAHLSPRSDRRQTCVSRELKISPTPAVMAERTDSFGNPSTFFTVQEPHRTLEVRALGVVDVHPESPPDLESTTPWEEASRRIRDGRDPESLDAYQFVFDSHYITRHADLAEYAAPSFTPDRPLLAAVRELTSRIYHEFTFDPDATTIGTSPLEQLKLRRGVCQDFAHLQVACLRSLGLAARYVSGYLLTNPPPGRPRLIGADMSHAWLSVYCPGVGWVDFDPTNDVIPSTKHITLAWGRDYDDVSPIKGVILGGGRHSVSVGVDVSPDPTEV